MFRLLHCVCLFPLACIYAGFEIDQFDKNKYGLYTITAQSFESCDDGGKLQKSPRTRKITEYKFSFLNDVLFYNLTVMAPLQLNKCQVRITMNTIKGDKTTNVINYNIRNICTHFALDVIVKALTLNKDCVLQKGNYLGKMSMTKVTQAFYGTKFFYGEYDHKATIRCASHIVICAHVKSVITKMPS